MSHGGFYTIVCEWGQVFRFGVRFVVSTRFSLQCCFVIDAWERPLKLQCLDYHQLL
jgi:hypothetical protein